MKAWLLKLLVEMSNEEYNLPLPPLSPSTTIPSLASRLLSTNPKAIYIKLKNGNINCPGLKKNCCAEETSF